MKRRCKSHKSSNCVQCMHASFKISDLVMIGAKPFLLFKCNKSLESLYISSQLISFHLIFNFNIISLLTLLLTSLQCNLYILHYSICFHLNSYKMLSRLTFDFFFENKKKSYVGEMNWKWRWRKIWMVRDFIQLYCIAAEMRL